MNVPIPTSKFPAFKPNAVIFQCVRSQRLQQTASCQFSRFYREIAGPDTCLYVSPGGFPKPQSNLCETGFAKIENEPNHHDKNNRRFFGQFYFYKPENDLFVFLIRVFKIMILPFRFALKFPDQNDHFSCN